MDYRAVAKVLKHRQVSNDTVQYIACVYQCVTNTHHITHVIHHKLHTCRTSQVTHTSHITHVIHHKLYTHHTHCTHHRR